MQKYLYTFQRLNDNKIYDQNKTKLETSRPFYLKFKKI